VTETSLDRNAQTEKDQTKRAQPETANTEMAHTETASPNRTERKVLFRSISAIVLEKRNFKSMFRKPNSKNNYNTKQFSQYVVFFEFCCCQNGNHGEHGADVLILAETEQQEEQDHAQMDRVALAWMKTQKRALWLNVPVRKQIAANMFPLSNTM